MVVCDKKPEVGSTQRVPPSAGNIRHHVNRGITVAAQLLVYLRSAVSADVNELIVFNYYKLVLRCFYESSVVRR